MLEITYVLSRLARRNGKPAFYQVQMRTEEKIKEREEAVSEKKQEAHEPECA